MGSCNSCRLAILHDVCFCRDQEPTAFITHVGRSVLRSPSAAKRNQMEFSNTKMLWVIRPGRFRTTSWFLCLGGSQTFRLSSLPTAFKMTWKSDQLPTLSMNHVSVNKPRNFTIHCGFTEQLQNASHSFPGSYCVWEGNRTVASTHSCCKHDSLRTSLTFDALGLDWIQISPGAFIYLAYSSCHHKQLRT